MSVICSAGLLVSPSIAEEINADVWADNWFSFYVNDQFVHEDQVSITTERSFNKESFSFTATRPFVLNFIAKDFKENDTGLEYISSNRQQMGDGGLIAQFIDSNNQVVAVTNDVWRCLVVHTAPIEKSCARESNPVAGEGACGYSTVEVPSDWMSLDFDDSNWPMAYEYSHNQVRPKDGYDRVSWNDDAQLIWGSDLETSNTILCRLLVE